MEDEIIGAGDQKPEPFNTSMRDQMAAAYDKVSATPETPVESDTPTETPVIETTPEPSGERQRGADGKFLKGDGAEQIKPAGAKPIEAAATPKPNSEQTTPAGSEPPPPGWSVDAKSQWATLSPAIKQAVIKREQDVSEGFRQKSEELKGYAEIGQILAPHQQALALNYGSVPNALKVWSQMNEFAIRDVEGFIKWYANSRGVDLVRLSGGTGGQMQQQQQQQSSDPHLAALQGQVQQIGSLVQNQLDQQQQQVEQQVRSDVHKFATDSNNLYYENVKEDMAALIKGNFANNLQEAYDQAIWRNPEIRSKLLAAQTQAADEARKADAAKKATQATRINATNLSSQGATGANPVNQDPREIMSAVYDRVTAA